MVEILRIIEIPHGTVELRSDDIITFRPNLATFKEYNLDVLSDLTDALVEISDGEPKPYLSDNRYITGFMGKKEQKFINENIARFATRCAIITKSPLVRILVNGYHMVFKPEIELKIFKTEADAVKWLLLPH